jgi:hypothetical protein
MTNNTLNTQATELLETTTIIRENKKVQLLQKNAIIKTYLSELNDYINNNTELMMNDKKVSYKRKLQLFKTNLLSSIKDEDKLTNNVYNVFNKCINKGITINILLSLSSEFKIYNRLSQLSNNTVSRLLKETITIDNINNEYKILLDSKKK